MSVKLDKDIVQKYLSDFLSSLKLSSKDHSWSVKDTAFYAATKFFITYPTESEEHFEEYSKFWN
jgi:hypothetical protein